jgi:hypothetical protein
MQSYQAVHDCPAGVTVAGMAAHGILLHLQQLGGTAGAGRIIVFGIRFETLKQPLPGGGSVDAIRLGHT